MKSTKYMSNICHIRKKQLFYDKNEKKKFKKYQNVRDYCHYTGKFRGAAHSICNLNYNVPQEIPVKIHNGSTYDYHFLNKELAEEFKVELECLGENTEKYISFSVPIKKEHENDKTITYKSRFIILVDSCKVNYQNLLITSLELIIKIAKYAWRVKISNQNVILLVLEKID